MPYTWYLYPKDDHTNEVFSRSLPGENFIDKKKCADGKNPPLWRCDHQFVERLKGSVSLKYVVYVQEGDGHIRPWKFTKKKRKHVLVPASRLPVKRV